MSLLYGLYAALATKLVACAQAMCLVGAWLVAPDIATFACGEPDLALHELTETGTFDVELYAMRDEARAKALDAFFAERGFTLREDAHYGGVLRGRLRLAPSEMHAFLNELAPLKGCLFGRSVLSER